MKPHGAYLAAIAAGFVVGFLWGRSTRDALASNTQASYAGGVLTVKLDTLGAVRDGLGGALNVL